MTYRGTRGAVLLLLTASVVAFWASAHADGLLRGAPSRRHLQQAATMTGYPCSIKGTIRIFDGGVMDIRSLANIRWMLAWSTLPGGIGSVNSGDLAQVDGRCDKTTRPFTLRANQITALGQDASNSSSGGTAAGSAGSGGSADGGDGIRVVTGGDGWWYVDSNLGSTTSPAASPPPGTSPQAPKPSPTPAPSPAPSPPPSPSPAPSLSPPPSPPPSSRPPPSPSPRLLSSPSPRAAPSPPVPSPPAGERAWPPLPPPTKPVINMTTLWMAVDLCGSKSSADVDAVKNVVSSALPAYFASASFGAVAMPSDPLYNRVLTSRVSVGCSGWTSYGVPWTAPEPLSGDNLQGWAEAADRYAQQRLNVDVWKYRHHIYLMPLSIGSVSFGAGNCPNNPDTTLRVWASSIGASVNDRLLANLVHELGHNLGLMHAQGYDEYGNLGEYGDASCPMGSAPVPTHYNAPNSVALGWTTPQAVLRAPDLPVGIWSAFKLRGLADAAVSSLQIYPGSWMKSGWAPADQLFISFRRYTPTNADSGLLPQYRSKVQVHSFSPDPFYEICAPSVLLANLDAANSTVWPKPGSTAPGDAAAPLLVVKVMEVDETAGAAYVSICRAQQVKAEAGLQCRDGLDNDCDGVVDNC